MHEVTICEDPQWSRGPVSTWQVPYPAGSPFIYSCPQPWKDSAVPLVCDRVWGLHTLSHHQMAIPIFYMAYLWDIKYIIRSWFYRRKLFNHIKSWYLYFVIYFDGNSYIFYGNSFQQPAPSQPRLWSCAMLGSCIPTRTNAKHEIPEPRLSWGHPRLQGVPKADFLRVVSPVFWKVEHVRPLKWFMFLELNATVSLSLFLLCDLCASRCWRRAHIMCLFFK